MAHFARYETSDPLQKREGIVCTGSGFNAWKPNICPNRRLLVWAAVWITKGSGWLKTEATDQALDIHSRTLFFLFPGVLHSYGPTGNGWTEHWVLFDGAFVKNLERMEILNPKKPVVAFQKGTNIDRLFSQIESEFKGEKSFVGLYCGSLIHQIIIEAHRASSDADEVMDAEELSLLESIEQLKTNAFQEIDYEKEAADCHMAYSTYRRKFKQKTGWGPKAFILRTRLNKAKELLAFTNTSIAGIAEEIGFDDPYYFSRLFHKKEGQTPSQFRKEQKLNLDKIVD